MIQKQVKITLISLKQPCSACLIIGGLVVEMLGKIIRDCNYVYIENIELDNLKDVHSIEGLEIENFPAIIINGEQITAGSLPMEEQLISIIRREAKIDEEN